MVILICRECGGECVRYSNGVTGHVDSDEQPDYDLDADHVAIPDEE